MIASGTVARSWEPAAARLTDDELADELRRRGFVVVDARGGAVLGDLELHRGRAAATWRGRTVGLAPREGDVLAALMTSWPRPVRAARLTWAVWGDAACENNARVYVAELRRRLPGLIETLRQCGGYRLAIEEGVQA